MAHGGFARLAIAPVAAALLLCPPPATAEEWPPPPLGWQEPSPVSRLFLQLPFESPEPLAAGRIEAEARIIYSNSILVGRVPGLTLFTNVETAQPTLSVSVGLGRGLELGAALPVVADWDGVLVQPIETIDRAVGSPNSDRMGHPRRHAEWILQRDDGRGVSRSGAGAGLGDGWIELKARLLEAAGAIPAVSARLALSLPTGRLPWGAGALVPAGGLLAAWRFAPLALRLSGDMAIPTRRLRELDLPTHPYGSFCAGLTIPIGERVAIQAQGSLHTQPLHGTGLAQLDHQTAYVLLGVTTRIGSRAVFDFGVVENIFSPHRGADISFVFALRGS